MPAPTFEILSVKLTEALSSQPGNPSGMTVRCTLGKEKIMVLVEYPLDSAQAEPMAAQTLQWLEQSLRQIFETNGLPEAAADLSEAEVPVQLFLKHVSEAKPFTMATFTWKVEDAFDDLFGITPEDATPPSLGEAPATPQAALGEAEVPADLGLSAAASSFSAMSDIDMSALEADIDEVELVSQELDDEHLELGPDLDSTLEVDFGTGLLPEEVSQPALGALADYPEEDYPEGIDLEAEFGIGTSDSLEATERPSTELSLPGEAPLFGSDELELPTVDLPYGSGPPAESETGDFFNLEGPQAEAHRSGETLPPLFEESEILEDTAASSTASSGISSGPSAGSLLEEFMLGTQPPLAEEPLAQPQDDSDLEALGAGDDHWEEAGSAAESDLYALADRPLEDDFADEADSDTFADVSHDALGDDSEATAEQSSSAQESPDALIEASSEASSEEAQEALAELPTLDLPLEETSATDLEPGSAAVEPDSLEAEIDTSRIDRSSADSSEPTSEEVPRRLDFDFGFAPTERDSFAAQGPVAGAPSVPSLEQPNAAEEEASAEPASEPASEPLPAESPLEPLASPYDITDDAIAHHEQTPPAPEEALDEINYESDLADFFAKNPLSQPMPVPETTPDTMPSTDYLPTATEHPDSYETYLETADDREDFASRAEPGAYADEPYGDENLEDEDLEDEDLGDEDLHAAYEAAEYEEAFADPAADVDDGQDEASDYYLAGGDEEALEDIAWVDEGEVERQRDQWQQQTKGNPWIFVGAIGFVVAGVLGFIFSRPCTLGSCDRLETAQQKSEAALSRLRQDGSQDAVDAARADIKRSVRMLSPIPVWSAYYDQAQSVLPAYESQLTALDLLSQAQSIAYGAAVKSQNPPHPMATWQEIAQDWNQAIEVLGTVPGDSPVSELANQKRVEYRANLSTIRVRIDTEARAEVSNRQAQQAASLATKQAQTATSPEAWEAALASWERAVSSLKQIPQGTNAYGEAQKLLPEYEKQLEEVRDRTERERNASQSLTSAKQIAANAQREGSNAQWTLAIQQWTSALNKLKAIPQGTLAHAEAQALSQLYTESLAKAENNRQVALRFQPIEPNLFVACGAADAQKCTYSVREGNIRLDLFEGYDSVIDQSITPPDQRVAIDPTAQIVGSANRLLQEVTLLSTQAQVPVELYNAKGDFMARYQPDLNGFVRQKEANQLTATDTPSPNTPAQTTQTVIQLDS